MSVDMRTRPINAEGPADPASFFEVDWPDAVARNGARSAADAARLGLGPLVIRVEDDAWTIQPRDETIEVVRGLVATAPCVTLDRPAFADLFCERRTALGLVIGARVTGDAASNDAFCAWDPVLRSLLDGRPVYQPGMVTLRSSDGSPLKLEPRFQLGGDTEGAGHFLAETGFLLLKDVFSETEMDELDADFARAVAAATVEDGATWWATTRTGERYPCRILDLAPKSPVVRALIASDRYVAIGDLLGDGHRRETRSANTSPTRQRKGSSRESIRSMVSSACHGTKTVIVGDTRCSVPVSRSASASRLWTMRTVASMSWPARTGRTSPGHRSLTRSTCRS